MSVLPGGVVSSGIDVGDIQNSLRFRSAGSCYLSKTFGSAGDRKKYTVSLWVKRGAMASGGNYQLFGAYPGGSGTSYSYAAFESDALRWGDVDSGANTTLLITSQVFRDPSAHMHLVFVQDTDNATADNRRRIYCNGVEITSFSSRTNPSSGYQGHWNKADIHRIGTLAASYFDGYISRVCFVDGTALTPSSFGYLNTEINEWVSKSQSACKAVIDAGGANSFFLDYTTSTLGADLSSKGNTWTSTGHSTTAGTTCDWPCKDVPGNSFATLNPIYPSATNITNGNLTSGTTAVRGTVNALYFNSKWEVTAGGSAVTAGVISSTGTTNTTTVTANKTFAFRLTTAGALDYKNVTDSGAWTSIATGLSGEQYPYGTTAAATWNFGQIPLHASATLQNGAYFYDTTSGYAALCQEQSHAGTVTVSGSFTGNASTDGPFVWLNGVPKTLTINSNAVTFGTHADKLATGFKLRTTSASYNASGSNSFTATIDSNLQNIFKYNTAEGNP